MSSSAADHRPTPIDAIADTYLQTFAASDPVAATALGVNSPDASGPDGTLTDYSPDAVAARTDDARSALRALQNANAVDDVDRVTVATMSDSLTRHILADEQGETLGAVNVIDSPLQAIRDVFDLMPVETAAQREAMVSRLEAIPSAIGGVLDGIRQRCAAGPPLARRQIELAAGQADSAPESVAQNARRITTADPGLANRVQSALGRAGGAFAALATELRADIIGRATDEDAVGAERYRTMLGLYLSADIDPVDAYEWGLDNLSDIVTDQRKLAEIIAPGAGIAGAMAALDADPRYTMTDREAFVGWMQQLADRAVSELAGTHFDVPDQLRGLECRLAPSATGGIYYTAPSENMTRPGRMWWSVPDDQTEFHTWQETTTVFHEGVPGHHLQLGSAMLSPTLNRWRKLASFTSGHGEGWALYAERLMDELGWLADPGDRMGMLDSQRLRAVRVVVDIGVHCRLDAPDSVGGGRWDAAKAWSFLCDSVAMNRSVLRFELNRYLGWPGQAPSYALGQQVWRDVREAYLAAHPDSTLREFHTRALALGGVGLDVLRAELGSD